MFFFFFFSSRRRHTRSLCDWSSDVCSSDLLPVVVSASALLPKAQWKPLAKLARSALTPKALLAEPIVLFSSALAQIGRASCRERVEISVVVGGLKKKRE